MSDEAIEAKLRKVSYRGQIDTEGEIRKRGMDGGRVGGVGQGS